jgi:hypothetical protein
MLALTYNPSQTTLEKIQNRIVAVGHDMDNKKAKDNYNALLAILNAVRIQRMKV